MVNSQLKTSNPHINAFIKRHQDIKKSLISSLNSEHIDVNNLHKVRLILGAEIIKNRSN